MACALERLAREWGYIPRTERQHCHAARIGTCSQYQFWVQRQYGPPVGTGPICSSCSNGDLANVALVGELVVPDGLRKVCRAKRDTAREGRGLSRFVAERLDSWSGNCGHLRSGKAADRRIFAHVR